MTSQFWVISAKQISILQGCCYCTARKEYHRLRDVLGLERGEPLRLRHVATVWDASVDDLAKVLY